MSNKRAWVTLATNDTYSLGALVLAHSLKKVNTKYELVILITSNVTVPMRNALQSVFNEVKEVNILDSGDAENLQLLARPELGVTFTKLHCWRLTQYEKCVFLDADTLVLQNCDDIFEREEFSAAPDVGWPDCFNSGVFVFKPAEETYKSIIDFALANGSFDGGDQGLLNMYFSSWATGDSSKRLPFLYNLSSTAIYSYLPAFKWYGKGVKIVHFIGNAKPWLQSFNSVSRTVSTDAHCAHLTNFLQYWWNLFCAAVHPQLSPEMAGLAQSLSQMKLEEPTPEQVAQEDLQRRQNWEQGNIDYLGRDSFDNIWSKISQTISPNAQSVSQQSESSPPSNVGTPVSPSPTAEEKSTPSLQCPVTGPESTSPVASESAPKSESLLSSATVATTLPSSLASAVSSEAIPDAPSVATSADPSEATAEFSEVTKAPAETCAPPQAESVSEPTPTSIESVETSPKPVTTSSDVVETSTQSQAAQVPPTESQSQSESSEKN